MISIKFKIYLNYKYFYKKFNKFTTYASLTYGYEKEANENMQYIIVDATLDFTLLNFM